MSESDDSSAHGTDERAPEESPDPEARDSADIDPLEALDALVDRHLERYPDLRAVDLYKLLHQAYCGPGHAIPVRTDDAADTWVRLREEAERVGAELRVREWERPTEPLDPRPGLVRVNLRPYLRAGGSLSRLHTAFVKTARELEPDTEGLQRALARVQRQLKRGELDVGFDLDELREVVADASRSGFGPRRHSPAYRELYAPAYRVVWLDHLQP